MNLTKQKLRSNPLKDQSIKKVVTAHICDCGKVAISKYKEFLLKDNGEILREQAFPYRPKWLLTIIGKPPTRGFKRFEGAVEQAEKLHSCD